MLSELLASLFTSPPARTMIWIRYTNSPLLTSITTLSCQPLQESNRLDPPLSLQRPQRPQHGTPLSTLKSTHQTHIPIQSKQHLQPSSRSNSLNSQNRGRHYYMPLTRLAGQSGSVSEEDGEADGEGGMGSGEGASVKLLVYLCLLPFL